MDDVQAENYKSFSERFQLAEQLQQGDKGVIFIGNTRAGKTTLSCAAAGSKIVIKHDSDYQLTFLHPADQTYSKLVRDTNQSVTTTPNFFKNNQLAIVDMPGYADSSRFKQFINYHYIKTMITNLKHIRFMVVITLSYSAGKYQLEVAEKRMLESFVDSFPDCKDCTGIIINRVQHRNEGHKQKEADLVKTEFRNLLAHQTPKIKSYFQTITSEKIHVIFRPSYKQNKDGSDWKEQYPQITQTMKNICFDKEAKYMSIANLKTKVHIFKEGDNIQNSNFRDLLYQILEEQHKGTKFVRECFQAIVVMLVAGLASKKMSQQEYQIEQILTNFQSKDQTEQYKKNEKLLNIDSYNTNYSMPQSKIIRLLIKLSDMKTILQDPVASQAVKIENINSIFGQLSWLTNSLFPQNKILKQKMNYLHLYTVRRLKQTFYIYKSINDQKIMDVSALQSKIQDIVPQIQNLNVFQKYFDLFREYLQNIFDSILLINLKAKFGNNLKQSIKKELIETLQNMKNLYQVRLIVSQVELIDKYVQKIDTKVKQIQLYFNIYITPTRPEEIKNYIETLLKVYHTASSRQQKNVIALKLALHLAKKQKKYAIALYFHLEIYEEVLRLVDSLLEPNKNQPKKNELVLKWYLALADQFKAKSKTYYFQRCLQKAKTLCLQDFDKLSEIKKRLKQGLSNISVSFLNSTISSKQQKELELESWNKIDQEILFLKALHKLEIRKKEYKVIGQKLRQ